MTQTPSDLVLLVIPALAGGIIAAINSGELNDATERLEAWIRLRQRSTSASNGWFLGYVVNPVLWIIVKFCDWTDDFTHRGLKNGTRVAAALYLIAAWLFVLYVAVLVVVAITVAAVAIYIAFKILGSFGNSTGYDGGQASSPSYTDSVARSSKSYKKTGMFTEEETGRTDKDGRIFNKTGMFSEDEVGRTDEDGRLYKKTGMFTEEETGRTDKDGKIFRKTGMFTEEEIGRVDSEGVVYKKTGMFTEEETARIERPDQD